MKTLSVRGTRIRLSVTLRSTDIMCRIHPRLKQDGILYQTSRRMSGKIVVVSPESMTYILSVGVAFLKCQSPWLLCDAI